ncbi:MAG TPA: lipase family protein, partial [Armatimonadota bacterium]|nr:lipase family protein [Armatimonadota bacterium]
MISPNRISRRSLLAALALNILTISGIPSPMHAAVALVRPAAARQRGRVVRSRVVAQFSRAQIDAALTSAGLAQLTPVRNGVRAYAVEYRTLDPHGRPAVASGLVAVPQGTRSPLPLLAYHHGTALFRTDVPSNPFTLEAQAAVGIFAAAGYLVVAPDYHGLGKSPGGQTFEQAEPLAVAGLDMLRAGTRLAKKARVRLNGQLFLCGYSQGGYATMALHRLLEREPQPGLRVTASAPMAGP